MIRFHIHDLRRGGSQADYDNIHDYLGKLHDRLHNPIHAETRVYTCRAWRRLGSAIAPYELHWNDKVIPGETFLGSFGWSVDRELIERIEAEFTRGESVRLFVFNSDSDLCFEEVLEPVHSNQSSVNSNI